MSFGNNLKALRESKGVSIEELSERTHVSAQIIEDFEAGVFSRISAAIYGSGFVKILATHLGVDPTPLREEFKAEYQAWMEAKAAEPKPKLSPQKFVERRVDKPAVKETKAVPPKPAIASPAQPPKAPAAPKPVKQPEPVVPVANSEGEGFGELFEPPKAKEPALAPAPEPIYEDAPPRRSFSEVLASLSQKFGGGKPTHQAEPPLFHDNLSKRKLIDFEEIKERVSDLVAMINPKIAIIAVASVLIICGFILLLSGGNGSNEVSEADEAAVSLTEAEALPPISFSGSALTDNLLPPPDCYAE